MEAAEEDELTEAEAVVLLREGQAEAKDNKINKNYVNRIRNGKW